MMTEFVREETHRSALTLERQDRNKHGSHLDGSVRSRRGHAMVLSNASICTRENRKYDRHTAEEGKIDVAIGGGDRGCQ